MHSADLIKLGMSDFKIQQATEQNCQLIHDLVKTTFDYNVAPDYSATGIKEFYKYIVPDAVKERFHNNHFILLAMMNDKPVGLIEIRNNNHISMFFILPEYQQKGIGRQLLNSAVEKIKEIKTVSELTLNSSPNAKDAYSAMGFIPSDELKEVHGIKFIPMKLKVA